jgi:hypothetical protein
MDARTRRVVVEAVLAGIVTVTVRVERVRRPAWKARNLWVAVVVVAGMVDCGGEVGVGVGEGRVVGGELLVGFGGGGGGGGGVVVHVLLLVGRTVVLEVGLMVGAVGVGEGGCVVGLGVGVGVGLTGAAVDVEDGRGVVVALD